MIVLRQSQYSQVDFASIPQIIYQKKKKEEKEEEEVELTFEN